MKYYKGFKHSKSCRYIYDCYRIEAENEDQAKELIKVKTGVTVDYVQVNTGNWDHPQIIDLD